MGKYIMTYRDYGPVGERSTSIFKGPDLTAANFDAEKALQETLRDAVEAISLGTLVKAVTVVKEVPYPDTNPASPFAQRENKWLVRYTDTVTGDKASLEIPCADLALLDPNAGDKADMSDADVAAFVAAFEAYVLSPGSGTRGNTEVVEIVFVGRNY